MSPAKLIFKVCIIGLFVVIIGAISSRTFDAYYAHKLYPAVSVNGIPFGGKSPGDVTHFLMNKNIPFQSVSMELQFDHEIATLSAIDIGAGYDATLSATQAYLIGRSSQWLTNLRTKFSTKPINIQPFFRYNEHILDETLRILAERINIPVQEALFQFHNGKVTAFKPSHSGRRINTEKTKMMIIDELLALPLTANNHIVISIPVDGLAPTITTDRVNVFGIKELIGRGYSEFSGSIPGRIHNVALASSKLHGVLIKPGETFSFNEAIGDISASTGYQAAYIIKEGRTVLGDGGGVCQVSSTLFRAALSAGLPIIERQAHAYRVHYYEEGGFKPGMDATVFSPTVDLKIKNDTPGYILIQTIADIPNVKLTFELYGTSDGRKSEILNHTVWNETPPPPTLYEDDPTLPKGVTRQVDFAAWGANTSFQYRVTRNGQMIQDTLFKSNFRPWRAVYLRGI